VTAEGLVPAVDAVGGLVSTAVGGLVRDRGLSTDADCISGYLSSLANTGPPPRYEVGGDICLLPLRDDAYSYAAAGRMELRSGDDTAAPRGSMYEAGCGLPDDVITRW